MYSESEDYTLKDIKDAEDASLPVSSISSLVLCMKSLMKMLLSSNQSAMALKLADCSLNASFIPNY